jgi:hypothetical protein
LFVTAPTSSTGILYIHSSKLLLMKPLLYVLFVPLVTTSFYHPHENASWIRINQLGYKPGGIKMAVWCSKNEEPITSFELVDSASQKTIFKDNTSKDYGRYGPFEHTCRLNFSAVKRNGTYQLRAGEVSSPYFRIAENVYDGAADFCLAYMRQQRSGYNPFLNDSCHTQDGYTLYGPMPDSSHIDVVGGWHDASDYLQYASTSANATWHLLAAYRDFPVVFKDEKQSNGKEGSNGVADVLDEAQWGLDWLLKMHPRRDWLFNQLGDDRDHISMRMPGLDSQYGRGYERPVYFINGLPQQRGKFENNTTGTSSTAAKFASAFALAHQLWMKDSSFHKRSNLAGYDDKALSAFDFALIKPGVTQTVSVLSPYIYAEQNWTDDMELAAASIAAMNTAAGKSSQPGWLKRSFDFGAEEKITPWLGSDTASHYQWYPFINAGHFELAKQLHRLRDDNAIDRSLRAEAGTVISWYHMGIERVSQKASQNAFLRGIPFIWCSNNLTTSFAIQCYWYRKLCGDSTYDELAQANIDWLFGCNPWGTSMVYGLPSGGDTPVDPHSAFTHSGHYAINGGLVDGPVYGSIYNNLIGIKLYNADSYAPFQSALAVYHDDYGDYSTNEPTMDGTASLVYLLAACEANNRY